MLPLIALSAIAQEFEAASIKPSPPKGGARPSAAPVISSPSPGRVSARNATLRKIIAFAFGAPEFTVLGPQWIDNDTYDIDAKAAAPVDSTQLGEMMQTLLAQRFHLALHRETPVQRVYEMTIASGGLKARESKPGDTPLSNLDVPRECPCFIFQGTSGDLSAHISKTPLLDAPVLDKTALTATYHFNIPHFGHGDDLVLALKEALGMQLTLRKSPIEVLVIDRADRVPVEN